MTQSSRSFIVAGLRRRFRPETLLTGARPDAPTHVPPRRTSREVLREYERRAAETQKRISAAARQKRAVATLADTEYAVDIDVAARRKQTRTLRKQAITSQANTEYLLDFERALEADLHRAHKMSWNETNEFAERVNGAVLKGLDPDIADRAVPLARNIKIFGVLPENAMYFPTGKVVRALERLLGSAAIADAVDKFAGETGGRAVDLVGKTLLALRDDKIGGLVEDLQRRKKEGDAEAGAALKRLGF